MGSLGDGANPADDGVRGEGTPPRPSVLPVPGALEEFALTVTLTLSRARDDAPPGQRLSPESASGGGVREGEGS